MSKKKIILGVVVAICAAILVFQMIKQEKQENVSKVGEQTFQKVDDKKVEGARKEEGSNPKDEDTGKEETSTKKQKTEHEMDEEKDTSEKDRTVESVKFPYEISNQGITVKTLRGYDGVYIEDGSDENVKKVAAILVKNNSKKGIEYGTITMETGEEPLEFIFSTLPAGKSCIVMEKNKTTYNKKWNIQSVKGDFAYVDGFSKLKSDISLKTGKNNGISITNKTGKAIPEVRIFYKYQMDSGEYVGGITYTCKVDSLEAGEKRKIYPSHFSSDGSVILMVRRYEEED